MSTILDLANDKLAIRIADDFSAVLHDHRRGMEWKMASHSFQEIGPLSDFAIWNRQERCYMDRYPAHYRAERTDSGLRVTVLDPLNEPRGCFTCRVALDDDSILFSLTEIDEALPSLIFPPWIVSESLVLPKGIGLWLREPTNEAVFNMPASGWRMRWFGGLRGDNGWLAIVDDGYADSGLYLTQLAACAAWQKSMQKWSPSRTLRLTFTGGGYVGMAKRFRSYAQQNGLFTSLRDKANEVPAVDNLIGGRCVSFFQAHSVHPEVHTYAMRPIPREVAAKEGQVEIIIPHRDVATIIAEAKAAGMQRGYFNLRGWLNGGYDETHPDVWPPEPALGSLDEFKAATSESGSFFTALHDNYQDMYTQSASFPRYVQRTPDGRLKAGGTWHGGRCYIVNSTKSLEYVHRNWEHFKTLGLGGMFLDTISGAHFQEDYAPEHLMTRTEDGDSKLGIVKFFKSKGMVIGSEFGSCYTSPFVDFVENRDRVVPGKTIPLWPLVYHDSVVSLRYASGTGDFHQSRDLEDMLWGYAKLWAAGDLANWRGRIEDFKASLAVDDWHRKIGYDEMTTHRYLNTEGTVERTEFSSGRSIIANFTEHAFQHEGHTIPAEGSFVLE